MRQSGPLSRRLSAGVSERRPRRRGNAIIGNDLFFLSVGFEGKDGYHSWFFQFAFAATAATIVSGPGPGLDSGAIDATIAR